MTPAKPWLRLGNLPIDYLLSQEQLIADGYSWGL
jgi:hypothetical protein